MCTQSMAVADTQVSVVVNSPQSHNRLITRGTRAFSIIDIGLAHGASAERAST